MRKNKMLHPSMVRLYEIAASHKDNVIGQSALARALNESPQTVKNWEARGISKGGAIKSQAIFGCNANELLNLSANVNTASDVAKTKLTSTKYPLVEAIQPLFVSQNVLPYLAPSDNNSTLQAELLDLFSQLDEPSKREWLIDLRGFVKGRRPHQDGSASAVAGQK